MVRGGVVTMGGADVSIGGATAGPASGRTAFGGGKVSVSGSEIGADMVIQSIRPGNGPGQQDFLTAGLPLINRTMRAVWQARVPVAGAACGGCEGRAGSGH